MSAHGGSRPRAEAGNAGWLRTTSAEALRDLFAVYEEHLEQIERGTEDWLEGHSELAPRSGARTTMSAERLEQTRARVRGAARGDFSLFRAHLEKGAKEHAEAGVSLGATYEDARVFTRELLPCLLRSYGSDSV